MSELHIAPHPAVIAVQAGIFIANLVVVKKLMLDPYLSVRDRREKLTRGTQSAADQTLVQCDELTAEVEKRLANAVALVKKTTGDIRQAAVGESQKQLSMAETEARNTVEAIKAQIQSDVAKEKAKLPSIVKQLTEEVFRLAVT